MGENAVSPTDRIPRSVTRFATVAAWTAIAAGIVGVGSWALDLALLGTPGSGSMTLRPSTASGLLACGLALLALRDPAADRRRRTAGRALATYSVVLGAAFVAEYASNLDLGFDQPSRLALNTALGFVLLGVALLSLDAPPRRGWGVGEVAAVPVTVVAAASLVGYAYSIPFLYGPASASRMSVPAAVAMLALSSAIALARPRGRLLRVITTSDPAAMMSRQLLPIAVLAPLLLGWLRLEGARLDLFGERVGTWLFTAATVGVLVVVIRRSAKALARADRARRALEGQLYRLASHDHLTGLFNRHRFEEELTRELRLARRHRLPGALLSLDLDGLKEVNDTLGHEAGDRLLCAVAEVLRARLRVTDPAARVGGDEFAVYLPQSSLDQAARVADDLRAGIAARHLDGGPAPPWSSVSVGVAEFDPSEGIDQGELFARADAAMYHAKRAGGDRVTRAPARVALAV